MSTYLQLCQGVCREAGIAQGEAAISAVTGNSGDLQRIVKWVAGEWVEIQNMHGGSWRWLRRTASVNTTASDGEYEYGDFTDATDAAVISRFNRWSIENPRDFAKCYLTSGGQGSEYWLNFIPWNDFKSIYKIGSGASVTGAPAHITIDPNNNIHLGPIPDDTYTITLDYYMSPQSLSANSDTPECPSQFHDVIMWKAVARYGYYKLKKEAIASGEAKSSKLLRQMQMNQMPRIALGAPLV